MYKPSEYLQSAVDNGNMIRIHNELCSIIHMDPTFRTFAFQDALNYVRARNIPEVIQRHDGRPFASKSDWNNEYWALVLSDLMDNFSLERIHHIEEVGHYLYGKVSSTISMTAATSTSQMNNTQTSYRSSGSKPKIEITRRNNGGKKPMTIAAIAGGVTLLGLLAMGAKKTIMVLLAVTVLSIVGAFLVKKKR